MKGLTAIPRGALRPFVAMLAATVFAAAALVTVNPLHAQTDTRTLGDDRLLELALANSERMQVAELSREQSELEVDLARSRRRPRISGSLDVSYLTNPLDPIVIRTGELGTYDIGGVATQVPPEDVRVYEGMEPTLFRLAGVLEQPLFTWGKLNLGVELAEEALALQTARGSQTRLEVELELRSAAAAARHLNSMAILAARQTELAGELVRLVEAALESGAVLRTDVLEARVGEQQAHLAVAELRNELGAQMVTLRRLTGRDDLEADELGEPRFGLGPGAGAGGMEAGTGGSGGRAGSAAAGPAARAARPDLSIRPTAELVTEALAANPGLAALDQAAVVAAVQRDLTVAETRKRPDIGMRLEFSFSGPRIPPEPDWYGQDEGNLTLGIGLQSTLYDGGSAAAEADLSRLDEASVAVERADAAEELAARVRSAVLTVELALARRSYLESNAELLGEKLAVRRREFDAGVGSRDAVVQAEMAVIANELEAAGELLTLEAGVVTLETLTGGEVVR